MRSQRRNEPRARDFDEEQVRAGNDRFGDNLESRFRKLERTLPK